MKQRTVMCDAVQMNFLLPLAMMMMMMMICMCVCVCVCVCARARVCVDKKHVVLHVILNNTFLTERNFYLQHINFVDETHETEVSPIPFVHIN